MAIYEDCDSRSNRRSMKFVVDGKKDEAVGVIMTYISWEIDFTSVESTSLIKSGRS
jgi:hypothetical protein